jgi:hypothetical protein
MLQLWGAAMGGEEGRGFAGVLEGCRRDVAVALQR